MENRRNYYRILQVQPDAPTEVIRSSYRTLMHTLKQHPDLGGDNWNASVLNEAYEILSDSSKRALYDRTFFKEKPMRKSPDQKPDSREICPICKQHVAHKEDCPRCSPLKKSPSDSSAKGMKSRDLQRHVQRMKKSGELMFHTKSSDRSGKAVLIDLSTKGVRFRCRDRLDNDAMIKLSSPVLEATAKISNTRTVRSDDDTYYIVGAEFLTVRFKKPKGSFVSTTS